MITCREVIGFLLHYLDGSLSAEEHARFEKHLRVCRSCVAYLRTYEATLRLERLTAIDESLVPEEMIAAVVASRKV